jgi:CBS domain-containing protein
MNESDGTEISRRPSPFGPAIALLPEDHQLIHINQRTSVAEALRIMIDNRFSQLPVMDAAKCVRGAFSFRSLSARVLDVRDANIDLAALPVGECLEKAKYVSADDYIDTSTAADFREDDYVIVGTPDAPKGILTVADIFVRLNDFAEAFVLLYETEDRLRQLIPAALGYLAILQWVVNSCPSGSALLLGYRREAASRRYFANSEAEIYEHASSPNPRPVGQTDIWALTTMDNRSKREVLDDVLRALNISLPMRQKAVASIK